MIQNLVIDTKYVPSLIPNLGTIASMQPYNKWSFGIVDLGKVPNCSTWDLRFLNRAIDLML
jgi:hypothetical protein